MTTGNREDYLISILRLTEGGGVAKTTELASFMGVSPASVSEMVKILSKEGLVEYAKYRGVKLTDDGLREARRIRKRHHVVEKFLTDVLDKEHTDAHEEASKMEHSISDETAVQMCHMLGNPPDCDCQVCVSPCRSVSGSGVSVTMTLDAMVAGDRGFVSHLKSEDGAVLKKLLALGFVPGKELVVDHRDDAVLTVTVNGASVAIDSAMASAIYVDIVSAPPAEAAS